MVSVGAAHGDSNVNVVSFDIAGTQKQSRSSIVDIGRSATKKGDLTSRESLEVLAAYSVGSLSGREEATSIRIGWDRLHTRRLVSQLTMFHKMHYHLVNIQIPQLISLATFIDKHHHQLKYAILVATMDM